MIDHDDDHAFAGQFRGSQACARSVPSMPWLNSMTGYAPDVTFASSDGSTPLKKQGCPRNVTANRPCLAPGGHARILAVMEHMDFGEPQTGIIRHRS